MAPIFQIAISLIGFQNCFDFGGMYPITNVGGVKSYCQARSIDVALFSASHIQRCGAVKLMVQLDSNSSVLFSLVYLLSFDKNHSLNCLVPILQRRSTTFKVRFGVI